MQKTSKTRILVECALMIALAVVLDILPPSQVAKRRFRFGFHGPDCISLLPSWYKMGTFDRFHLLHRTDDYRIYAPPAGTVLAFALCILLDYVIAFTILGAADLFAKPFSNRLVGYTVGALAVTFIRFVCSFLSGILIWDSFAPEGQPVWLYSLTYNGGYMIPNMIVTAVIIALLCLAIDPKTLHRPKKSAVNA